MRISKSTQSHARPRRCRVARGCRAVPLHIFRVATDCSGLDVPIAVFEELDIATDHVFSSERNQTLREFIEGRFAPRKIYNDMAIRNNHIPCPEETDLDFYAAGLPCQPFSKSGKNLGVVIRKMAATESFSIMHWTSFNIAPRSRICSRTSRT